MIENSLHIIPLGGLGEIGLNCLALECGQDILVIDAGLMFPEANMPGVELVIPDFSYLAAEAHRVRGLILTHGHEDHIGALAYFLNELEAPVYGSKLTLALAKEHLKSQQREETQFVEVGPRQKVDIGCFGVEFIRVNHSILDGLGLAITTPAGVLIHTGDFRIDQTPSSDDHLDLFKFAEYGENGVLALLSDSTNAAVPGCTPGENVVRQALEDIIRKAEGRVILACFASSLARVREVILAAKSTGRKVVFEGRSMISNVKLAKSLGYLDIDPDLEVPAGLAQDWPDGQLLVVATGSQGEPMSALARMAYGDHKHITIKADDTVILSSRSIPGHEKDITQLVDRFYRQGARVIDGRMGTVHASGHAQAEELKLMMNLVMPRYVVPVHGSARELVTHSDLAKGLGWAPEDVWVLSNGQRLILSPSGAYLGETAPTGRKLVDGNRLGEPEDPVLRSRLKLAGGGFIMVTVVLSKDRDELAAPPQVTVYGVHYEDDLDLSLEAAQTVELAIEQWREDGGCYALQGEAACREAVAAIIQKEVRQLYRSSISIKPSVWPQIVFV